MDVSLSHGQWSTFQSHSTKHLINAIRPDSLPVAMQPWAAFPSEFCLPLPQGYDTQPPITSLILKPDSISLTKQELFLEGDWSNSPPFHCFPIAAQD